MNTLLSLVTLIVLSGQLGPTYRSHSDYQHNIAIELQTDCPIQSLIPFGINRNVCDTTSIAFQGYIRTENGIPVANVEVTITIDTLVQIVFTDQNGRYQFLAKSSSPSDIVVSCNKTDDPRIGVSTVDLVVIQKHLLGLRYLTSPYKLIAADANNSLSVSAIDLVEIRKVLLGLLTGFPNNTSWRFVPVGHEFDNPIDPWPFPETNEGIAENRFDFIAIKVGDVNNTYRGE